MPTDPLTQGGEGTVAPHDAATGQPNQIHGKRIGEGNAEQLEVRIDRGEAHLAQDDRVIMGAAGHGRQQARRPTQQRSLLR